MSNDELFAADDLITDGLDNSAYGLARLKAGNVYVTAASGSIQNGVDAATDGDIVNVQAGTFTLPGTVYIDKSLSLVGAGEGATNIDGSAATNYAMRMRADDISLSDFTLSGPGGISVFSQGSGVVHNASISNVTIDTLTSSVGVSITQADGVALDHVTVDGTNSGGGGNGVQIVDSANVALTNVHTVGNQGGLVIVENGGPIQTNNISADTTNNFQDPVIIADFSAGAPGLGSVNVQGFQYAIGNSNLYGSGPGRLSNDQQNTIDTAVALGATDSFIEGWTGTGVNNTFTVGTSTGGTALSVNTAIGAASTGGTINVNTGTYGEDVSDAKQLAFNFGDVNVNSFTLASGGAGSSLNGNLTATGAIAPKGASSVTGNLTAASFSSNATLAMTGNIKATGAATFNGASTITGNVTADSITDSNTLALAGNLAATHGISLGGASAIVGNLSGGSIATTAPLTLIGNATSSGAVSFGGTTGVTGNVQGATIATTGPLTLVGNATASGGVTFGGVTSVTGNVKGSAITANNTLALNGSATASGAITANGAALLSGNLTGGSIALNGATTLTGNTTLDTSAANGAISTASVDGTTAGGQSLGINAGTGTVSLGDLGAATRLGAVSDASNTTLTGSTYNANSFLFGGDVTLTSSDTTLNTTQSASAAGDITFQGDLFGTTDAAQSLTLIAGPGTGAASANGNITLQNAGTSAVYLNDLTVSGNDFTALTVDVGGDYNALLTGNQVFAADTLNVRGNASSIVGGDASGHIVAGGDVTIAAGGDISGTISGQNVNLTGDDVNSVVTATNAANIKGNTVEGSYTANTVTLIASNNVDAAVDATDFTLAANHGSVDGNWVTINTDGSNVVSVNGQTTVGLANVNPNQLVVEGFVLPAGTRIGANGQLILPQGVLLGLLSPGGGKPKMILVHSVQQLGELLAGGYSVIVIDLSNRDSGKPIQLASN
jgi:cytoskeletal protein CcmA (bactofilin family)